MRPIAKARCACLTALVVAAAPSLAVGETRWDKKACEYFTHVRNAKICTLQALESFAPLVNEPAQLIAEQSFKKCAWEYQYLYDHEGHIGVDFDQYVKSWASQFVVEVLESRLPAGNPRPETDVERDIVRIYTEKLLKDCGKVK